MTEFYEGQAVYLCPTGSNDTWVRGVVQNCDLRWLVIDGLIEVDIQPKGPPIVLLAWPGELVRGDGG